MAEFYMVWFGKHLCNGVYLVVLAKNSYIINN